MSVRWDFMGFRLREKEKWDFNKNVGRWSVGGSATYFVAKLISPKFTTIVGEPLTLQQAHIKKQPENIFRLLLFTSARAHSNISHVTHFVA
ncbi:hypothetical protein QDY66_03025 [Kingella negevensis]|uniref:hypothetical protein n=1 Tax=Kingella negevensis TaxID=1522312 RepID=UPI00117B751E|nr:hypothetical protein [Kingella negevensis]MDK4692658.1 hypothetical protein [Kingella negevensis]MDK4698957.1 hypothetical protein [Kingella negevensis]